MRTAITSSSPLSPSHSYTECEISAASVALPVSLAIGLRCQRGVSRESPSPCAVPHALARARAGNRGEGAPPNELLLRLVRLVSALAHFVERLIPIFGICAVDLRDDAPDLLLSEVVRATSVGAIRAWFPLGGHELFKRAQCWSRRRLRCGRWRREGFDHRSFAPPAVQLKGESCLTRSYRSETTEPANVAIISGVVTVPSFGDGPAFVRERYHPGSERHFDVVDRH